MSLKKNARGMAVVIALLIVANACLDYSAICAYFDIDMFGNLGVKHLLALIVSVGCGLTLYVLPALSAQEWARGSRASSIVCMAGCAAVAVIFAGLRAAADATSTTVGIDGTVQTTMTSADVLFVLVMFCLSVGESAASLFYKSAQIREERTQLNALLLRLQNDLDQVDSRIAAVNDVAEAKKLEAAAAARSAGETLFQGLLGLSGNYQNAFIGFAGEADKSRKEFTRTIDQVLADHASAVQQAMGERALFATAGAALDGEEASSSAREEQRARSDEGRPQVFEPSAASTQQAA